MRARDFLTEYRDRMFQYVKSVLPKWPDYVLRDWIYNLARGTHRAGPGWDPQNPNWKFNRDTILKMVAKAGLSPDTQWTLNPRQQFTMDMWEPKTRQRLIGRAGGTSDLGMGIPRDKERHATQAALAQQQGGVRKEPVILIKTSQGYELAEGWHRTIQHFAMYPQGYTGPAYIAVSQGVAEGFVIEGTYDSPTHSIKRRPLNVPLLIQKGAIFVTYPHGEQGWETGANVPDWQFSLITLHNVYHESWCADAKKYLKPKAYNQAAKQINQISDGKYNQILWSIEKLGIPEEQAFLDKNTA